MTTRLTKRDLTVINAALAHYEAELEGQSGYDEWTYATPEARAAQRELERVRGTRWKVHERLGTADAATCRDGG